MERLLYISESQIEPTNAQPVVTQIVSRSVHNNAQKEITGALLFTGTHFAQILEGTPRSIEQLMSVLIEDPRHQNVRIVERSPISSRKFPDWKMAYFGPSQFVSRHVLRLLNENTQSEQRRATEWLTELAHEFSIAKSEERDFG